MPADARVAARDRELKAGEILLRRGSKAAGLHDPMRQWLTAIYDSFTLNFSPLLWADAAGWGPSQMQKNLTPLNEREIEVLTLVARGRTSTQIARKLKLVPRTVDFHVANARRKLRAANRTEAVTRAVAARLIKPY